MDIKIKYIVEKFDEFMAKEDKKLNKLVKEQEGKI